MLPRIISVQLFCPTQNTHESPFCDKFNIVSVLVLPAQTQIERDHGYCGNIKNITDSKNILSILPILLILDPRGIYVLQFEYIEVNLIVVLRSHLRRGVHSATLEDIYLPLSHLSVFTDCCGWSRCNSRYVCVIFRCVPSGMFASETWNRPQQFSHHCQK